MSFCFTDSPEVSEWVEAIDLVMLGLALGWSHLNSFRHQKSWTSNILPFEVTFPLLAQATSILIWDMYFNHPSLLFSSLQPNIPLTSPDTCYTQGEGGQESQSLSVSAYGFLSTRVQA